MFGYTIHCPDATGTEYIYDGALTIMHNLLIELAGPGWSTTEVLLNRDEPNDIAPRRHFRARLRFGAEKVAIVFPFYGFNAGDVSQWEPMLTRNTTPITPFVGNPKWNLVTAMADEAIGWLSQLNDIDRRSHS